eukprot:7005796-Alexandrium_andersonii.AAC.1
MSPLPASPVQTPQCRLVACCTFRMGLHACRAASCQPSIAHAALLLSHRSPAIVAGACWTVMRGRTGSSCSTTQAGVAVSHSRE